MTRVTLIHVGDFRESYLREALLAAGERSGDLPLALLQARKLLENLIQRRGQLARRDRKSPP